MRERTIVIKYKEEKIANKVNNFLMDQALEHIRD